MIYYLCNGKAPCRGLYGTLTECSYINPEGECRHTTMEEFAKNWQGENPRDSSKFREERIYGNNNVIYTDYWEEE